MAVMTQALVAAVVACMLVGPVYTQPSAETICKVWALHPRPGSLPLDRVQAGIEACMASGAALDDGRSTCAEPTTFGPSVPVPQCSPDDGSMAVITTDTCAGVADGAFVFAEACTLPDPCPADVWPYSLGYSVVWGPIGCLPECPDGSRPRVGGWSAGQVECGGAFGYNPIEQIGACYICPEVCPPGGCGDPHFVGFEGTQYDVKGKDGLYYNLVTEADHALNARFGNVGSTQVEYLWMTELGMVYKNSTIAVKLLLDQTRNLTVTGSSGAENRMMYEKLEDLLQVDLNGESHTEMLKTDGTMSVADNQVLLYFPRKNHAKDPTDGPVLVIQTPAFEVTILLETEGVMHLDFAFKLLGNTPGPVHGLVGQSINWSQALGNNFIEGSEDDYIVSGLYATDGKFSKFGGSATDGGRGRMLVDPQMLATTQFRLGVQAK